MDDGSSDEWAYAPSGTLKGSLQRGRGLGALWAVREPQPAGELVYEAVRRDWRWDSVDDRHLYLARLVRDLELSPEPVIALLGGDEDDCERATRVLELLALSGSVPARRALRAYVREGEHWTDVLQSIAGCWPVEWWDDLADTARNRLTDDEPLLWRSEPWIRWRTGRGTAAATGCRPRVSDVEIDPTNHRLLARLADPEASEPAKAHALRLLSLRAPEPALLLLVPSLGTADDERPLPFLGRAVERLGALAVPAAREWTTDGRPWFAWIGAQVLAGHGEARDIPALVGLLAEEWGDRSWCGPSTLAAGLARFGRDAAEAAPLLRRYWLHTPHSYERPAYLEALAAIDPAGLEQAYTESLWDCESRARLLGIAFAPDLPYVRSRIADLRDDPMEEAEVRAAAAGRAGGAAPPQAARR